MRNNFVAASLRKVFLFNIQIENENHLGYCALVKQKKEILNPRR